MWNSPVSNLLSQSQQNQCSNAQLERRSDLDWIQKIINNQCQIEMDYIQNLPEMWLLGSVMTVGGGRIVGWMMLLGLDVTDMMTHVSKGPRKGLGKTRSAHFISMMLPHSQLKARFWVMRIILYWSCFLFSHLSPQFFVSFSHHRYSPLCQNTSFLSAHMSLQSKSIIIHNIYPPLNFMFFHHVFDTHLSTHHKLIIPCASINIFNSSFHKYSVDSFFPLKNFMPLSFHFYSTIPHPYLYYFIVYLIRLSSLSNNSIKSEPYYSQLTFSSLYLLLLLTVFSLDFSQTFPLLRCPITFMVISRAETLYGYVSTLRQTQTPKTFKFKIICSYLHYLVWIMDFYFLQSVRHQVVCIVLHSLWDLYCLYFQTTSLEIYDFLSLHHCLTCKINPSPLILALRP
ncbi:hypothetical protein VP01_3108g1 [Puccinia sorghi]|uniref:Uncharacterized protein n=1 Tax=Puccinia sorghi TaxID=27349 RepID=A0A0L6UZE1_9BASI|nr:hypothetical protein VP01_3108g1 [Puccinia sorghi]